MSNRMTGSVSGFTTIEMVIVVVVMGVIATMAFPRIRAALDRQNVRSARAASQTFVATARAAAVQRGCRATFQMRADGRIWVTVCATAPAPGQTLDTLGPVVSLGARYNVTLEPSRDSLMFDARGLKVGFERLTLTVRNDAIVDSLIVNEVGKVVRQ